MHGSKHCEQAGLMRLPFPRHNKKRAHEQWNIPRWSESLECANMRSNNLNKYAITHFIMHITWVLSAILFSSCSDSVAVCMGTCLCLSLCFASYILHVAYLVIQFSNSLLLLRLLAREFIEWLAGLVKKQKNVIKINSNDKSNKAN